MPDYTPIQLDAILTWLLRLEDRPLIGLVVSLGDGAGRTRFGITDSDVDNFDLGDFMTCPTVEAIPLAERFYKSKYWDRMNLGQYDLPLSASILSCAVNAGVSAAELLISRSKYPDGSVSLPAFISEWKLHYRRIVAARPDDAKFLDGWLNRVNAIYPKLP